MQYNALFLVENNKGQLFYLIKYCTYLNRNGRMEDCILTFSKTIATFYIIIINAKIRLIL